MKEVVIIGAGKIGRGYMGQIFSEAGYAITFVDILPDLIDALNDSGQYQICEVDTNRRDVSLISIGRALYADDVEEVSKAIARVNLVITCVGAGNLPAVAIAIANGIRQRITNRNQEPLNVLVAENLMNGAQKFSQMIAKHLSPPEIDYQQELIGIVGTVIGRTVPPPPPAFDNLSIVDVIVEPHREFYGNQMDVKGALPAIEGVHWTNQYDALVSRKLYVHNCSHAVMGYLGFHFGHQYSHEAMADERVAGVVWEVMQETAKAVACEFGFSQQEMRDYITDLFQRYQNQELWDTLIRISKDPVRKLHPEDRLVGAARLIEKTGEHPIALSQGIAGALLFNSTEDPKAISLQKKIEIDGIEQVLEAVTGIKTHEELGKIVLEAYHHLRGD